MDMVTVIGIIVIAIGGIGYSIYMIKNKNREAKGNNRTNSQASQPTQGEIKKNPKEVQKKDVIDFMEFERVADNMIIQEKETKYTMAIQCKGINYDLMSEVEQLSVEEGFITFLNTLKFPIQLYVQARAVDLKKSIDIYKKSVEGINEKFESANDKLKRVSGDIDAEYKEIEQANVEKARYENMLDYARDITRYVERISLNKHVLQRKFYILLSYYKSEVNTTSQFTKEEVYEICHRELYTRAQSVISGLMGCSVEGKVLSSNDLAEMLYISYNRDDEKLIDIKTALESGFYRLYSTSKDVVDKRQELLEKEILEESKNRVQDAIVKGLEKGIIKTKDELIEEYEDKADKGAVNIIQDSDIDDDTKEKLVDIVAENHVRGVEERRNQRITRRQEEQKKHEEQSKRHDETIITNENNEQHEEEQKIEVKDEQEKENNVSDGNSPIV